MEKFSDIADWLEETSEILTTEPKIQTKIFSLINRTDLNLNKEDEKILKMVLNKTLELSFVVQNNKEQLSQLIKFLN